MSVLMFVGLVLMGIGACMLLLAAILRMSAVFHRLDKRPDQKAGRKYYEPSEEDKQ